MKKRLLISLLAVGAIFSLASCKEEIFTVSFDSEGTVETLEVTENGLIVAPTDPTKEGYTFGGWYLDQECTQKVDFETYKVVGDVTLYAQWLINSYTVSFEENGGSSVEDITVEYGKPATMPANPTMDGHVFVGWYVDQNLTGPYTNGAIKEDTTLYAKWRSNVVYSGSFSGEGTYNADGTYSFEIDLPLWGRFTVYYNREPLAANDENLVISGLFTEGTADWTMNLYCDVPEGGSEVDYTTFITSTGGKYRVTYDPASNTLDFQDATPPIEIPQEGLCFQFTDPATNKLGEATVVEANDDGSYTFVVELAQWRYVKMHYNGEVVDTAVNATLQSSGNIYIGGEEDPSYAFYTNQAGKFEFTYIPAVDGGMAVVKAGPYKDPSEMPEGVAFGYTITQGVEAVEVLVDPSNVTVENGVYTVTVTLEQWRYVVIYVDGVAIPVADMTISGDGWVDGTYDSSSNGSLYVPEDPTHLMTSQKVDGGIQYTVSYNPTDKTLVIDNLSISEELLKDKLIVGGTFAQELEAVDGVYTLEATFAAWNRFSFTLNGVELTTENTTITGCFLNEPNAPWDERFYTEDGKLFLVSAGPNDYVITYTVETNTINIALKEVESPVPAEGVYFAYTNPDNVVTYPADGEIEEIDGNYSFTCTLQAWRYVVVYYNGVALNVADMTISGDGWVDGSYNASSNGSLYVPEDPTQLMTSQSGGISYKLTYNPTDNTLIINNLNIEDEIEESSVYTLVAEAKGLSWTEETQLGDSGVFFATNKVKTESLKISGASYEADGLTFEFQYSLTGGKVQVSDGVVSNGIKLVLADYTKVTLYAAQKSDKSTTLKIIDAEGNEVAVANLLIDGVAADAWNTLPTDKVSKYEFNLPAGTYYLGGAGGGPYVYQMNVEYVEEVLPEVPAKLVVGGTFAQELEAVDGVYTLEATFAQWNRFTFTLNDVQLTADNTTITGLYSGVGGAHWNLQFYTEDGIEFLYSASVPNTYVITYTVETNTINIALKGTPEVPADTKLAVGGTFAQELAAVDGVYTLEATFAAWNRFSFNYFGLDLSTENTTITGLFVNEPNAPWDERFYTEDGKLFLVSAGPYDYVITYTVATNTINIALKEVESPVPAEGVYFAYTNPDNVVTYPAEGEIVEENGAYSFTFSLNQWRYAVVYYNGVALNVADMTISGDGWVDGTYDASANGSLYVPEDPTHLMTSQAGGISYTLTYNPTDNTLVIDNLNIEPLITTTEFEIAQTEGVSATNQHIYVNSVALTNNFSVSGKLVIGTAGTNPHIQFSLDDSNFNNRFLLWDNDTNGSFIASYAFSGSHVANSGKASVAAGEEVLWEVVTTEKHSYFYINGVLEFVFLNFNAQMFVIGAEKTQVSVFDIVSVTSENTEAWAEVLARKEIARYESSTNTSATAIVHVEELLTTTEFEIAETVGIANTNTSIYKNGEVLINNYSVSGKLVIGTTANNPHIQFLLASNNRFLLWDNDTNGSFIPGYQINGTHKAGTGKASFAAGEEITWEVVTTDKHSYFYVNGELEFVFLNINSTALLIGAEKTQVSFYDIVTVTSADTEAWAAVLDRIPVSYYEASEETALKDIVFNKSLINTTSMYIPQTEGVGNTVQQVISNSEYITNNYSVSGKLVVGSAGTNPHIQFSLDATNFQNRFLLWDNNTDGTYNAAYAVAGSHKAATGKAAFAAGDVISWEVVTTDKHSYFYVNGTLEFVFLNFNAKMLLIGAEKTEVTITDIVTVTTANADAWAGVLAREELAYWENVNLDYVTVAIPGQNTTSFSETVTQKATYQIFTNGVAATNCYSISGKLKVTEVGTNSHIQFSLKSGNRFLLWDQNSDGVFNGGYQFNNAHVNNLSNISFGANEEISWELVTTVRHSYLYINGELKFVLTNLNSTSVAIGANVTGIEFYDITTVTKAFNSTEWESVLARAEIAEYEALEDTTAQVFVK